MTAILKNRRGLKKLLPIIAIIAVVVLVAGGYLLYTRIPKKVSIDQSTPGKTIESYDTK